MKKIFQAILIIIILGISGYIYISNVQHIIFLNTITYTYDFKNGNEIKSIKKSLNKIENNVEKIKNLKNSYLKDEEKNKIETGLVDSVKKIKALEFWNYDNTNNIMNQVSLFKLIQSNGQIGILSSIDQYRTLTKYNDSLDIEGFIEYSYLLLTSSDSIFTPLFENYKYSSNNTFVDTIDLKANSIMNILLMKIKSIEYISNLVVESGDINE